MPERTLTGRQQEVFSNQKKGQTKPVNSHPVPGHSNCPLEPATELA